jgi:beta-lactamase superfamily II metal-dependent hydrolase
MIELRLLPARQGDAIWIRWGDSELKYQMIVDMGTQAVGTEIRERLEALDKSERKFELLVITHIDADHIGGVLSCLVDSDEQVNGLHIEDVWFNGLNHIEETRPRTVEEMGGVQGKRLSDWLEKGPWNNAFGGGAVCRNGFPPTKTLAGEMKITVLGPTPARLAALAPQWRKEVAIALRKKTEGVVAETLEVLGPRHKKPQLSTQQDLHKLAAKVTGSDLSRPNGTSIVLLLEHGGYCVLLAADSYASDLIEGIRMLQPRKPLALDAFKLPHHGSRENTTKELIESVDCPRFLFSTDGTQFEHPHAEAVACVIESSVNRPAGLFFNSRSKFTLWWEDNNWMQKFGYTAAYGRADEGYTLSLSD